MTDDSKKVAELVVTKLRMASENAPLQPFGEGPIESELAGWLNRESNLSPDEIASAIRLAFDWCLSDVLDKEPHPTAYGLLTSVALTAGFAKVPLEATRVETLAEIIASGRIRSQAGREALGMLLRIIARSGTGVDIKPFERLVSSKDNNLRGAALELLGRQRSPSFIRNLVSAMRAGFRDDQLLWALIHDHNASAILAAEATGPANSILSAEIENALSRVDPSKKALETWQEKKALTQRRQQKSWAFLDYRVRDANKAIRRPVTVAYA